MATQGLTPANVSANVSVTPILSQSVLTTILLISIIPLSVGFYFLWHEKDGTWIPFIIFFVLIAIACIGWWRSQKSIDMGNASPTQITDKHGNKLVTDTRVLESSNAIAQLGDLLQSIGFRNPLPEPDGMVDSNGLVIPDSQDQARNIVDKTNNTLSVQTQEIVDLANGDRNVVIQDVISLPEESNRGILDHNRPESDEPA
jgi:hypothetical protein